MPLIHQEKLEPCKKCGNTKPQLDSDDMVPCWMVHCGNANCDQSAHASDWSYHGAVREWNNMNKTNSDSK